MDTLIKIILASLSVAYLQANAQTLFEETQPQQYSTYIFVSTKMPREALKSLARESIGTGASLVLNGLPYSSDSKLDIPRLQQWIAQMNHECCNKKPVAWLLHPPLFTKYKITEVPAFVIGRNESERPQDYSVVRGDMHLANAMKFIAQESKNRGLKFEAEKIYGKIKN